MSKQFVLRINVNFDADVRRFCEVRVDRNDNVYVFQPHDKRQVKVSYHTSGQRHLKISRKHLAGPAMLAGPPMFVLQLDRPEWIVDEESVWTSGFQDYKDLLPYKGERADAICDIDLLPPLTYTDGGLYAEVSMGQSFNPGDNWSTEDWTQRIWEQKTLKQDVFTVSLSPSKLKLCVRLLHLTPQG